MLICFLTNLVTMQKILDDAITSFEVTAVFLYSVYNKGGFGLIPSLHLIPRSGLFIPSQTEINQVQKPDTANQFYTLSPILPHWLTLHNKRSGREFCGLLFDLSHKVLNL